MIAWRIPNSQLHVLDDGHLFLITRAETVAPIIMKFLQEERQRGDHAPATNYLTEPLTGAAQQGAQPLDPRAKRV